MAQPLRPPATGKKYKTYRVHVERRLAARVHKALKNKGLRVSDVLRDALLDLVS